MTPISKDSIIGFLLVGLACDHVYFSSGFRLGKVKSREETLDRDEEINALLQVGKHMQTAERMGAVTSEDSFALDRGQSGAETSWFSKDAPPPPKEGKPHCRCISAQAGTRMAQIGKTDVLYPSDVGSHCAAWDNDVFPGHCEKEDQVPGRGKGWCARNWCYVDPCSCDLGVAAMTSYYFQNVTYNGRKLHFSYATCDNEHEEREPCSQHTAAQDCKAAENCEWTGQMCLQFELAPLCAKPA